MKSSVSAAVKSVYAAAPSPHAAPSNASASPSGPSNRFIANAGNVGVNLNGMKGSVLVLCPQGASNSGILQHQVTPVPSPSSSSATPPHLSSASSSPSITLPPPSTPNMLQPPPHSPHQQQRFHSRHQSQQQAQGASTPSALLQPEPQLPSQSPCHSQSQSQSQCPLHHQNTHQHPHHHPHPHQHQHPHPNGQQPQHPHAHPHPHPHPHAQTHVHPHVHAHGHHGHHSLSSSLALSPLLCADQIVGKLFRVRSKIGSGSFGEIYHGTHVQSHTNVAIKVERQDSKYPQLLEEYKVYNSIRPAKGFPQVYWYGTFGQLNVLVMDLLGPSLETLYHKCGRKFSIRTVALLALQLLERIEHQHSHCYLHRDVKPDNFLLGRNADSRLVYVIDMGLAKQYRDPRSMQHIPKKDNKKLIGTPRYASINTHLGLEQCRRDDLESIGYMLLYFALGRLPWQGLKAKTKQEKYDKISERKKSIPIHELCASLPDEFCRYLAYVRSLRFEEEPDYSYLRALFLQLLDRNGWHEDDPFDWQLLKKEELQPAVHTAQDIQFVVRQISAPTNSQSINPFLRNHAANAASNGIFGGAVAQPNLSVLKASPSDSTCSTGKAAKKKSERHSQQRNSTNVPMHVFNLPNQAAAPLPTLANSRLQSHGATAPMASTPSLASSTLPLPLPPSSSSSLPLMLTGGLPPQFQVQFSSNANNQLQTFVFGRSVNNACVSVSANAAGVCAASANVSGGQKPQNILSPRPHGMPSSAAIKAEGNSPSGVAATPMLGSVAAHSPQQQVTPVQASPAANSPPQLQPQSLTHSRSLSQELFSSDLSSPLPVAAVQRATTDASLPCLSDVLSAPAKGGVHSVGNEELLHAFESVENERDLLRKRVSKYEHMLHGYRYELVRMKEHIQKFTDKPYQFSHPLLISHFGLATHPHNQIASEADPSNPLLASRAVSAATGNISLDPNEALPSLASLGASAGASAAVSKVMLRHVPATSHLSHSSSSRVGSPALALASPSVESSSSPVQSPPISPNPLQASSAAASAALSPSIMQRNQSHSPILAGHSLKRKTPNSLLFAVGSGADAQACEQLSASALKRMRTSLLARAFSGDDEEEDSRMVVADSEAAESNVLQHMNEMTATL